MKFLQLDLIDLAVLDLDERSVRRRTDRDLVSGVAVAVVVCVTGWLLSGAPFALLLGVACASGIWVAGRTHRLVRREAQRARRQVELAAAVFLDLVNVMLAGGSGIETAVAAAASAGDGPGFSQLRIAVMRAQSARDPYWSSLGALGSRIGVNSLMEVAHTIQLAGEGGARVRNSLEARSVAMRKRNLACIEHESEQQTEKMGLPLVVLFLGFLVLVGYPAFNQTLSSL